MKKLSKNNSGELRHNYPNFYLM